MLTTQIENFETLINELKENESYSDIKIEILEENAYGWIETDVLIDRIMNHERYLIDPEDFEIDLDVYELNKREILNFLSTTINLLTNDEQEYLDNITDGCDESEVGNKMYRYIKSKEWKANGQQLKRKREALGVSIAELSRMLETSPSRISNLEHGKPVMMSKHLEKAYLLALDSIKNARSKSSKVEYICLNQYCDGDLYLIELVTEDGQHVHIQDIEGLQSAYRVAKIRFQNDLKVPIILQNSNGGSVNIDELVVFAN